MGTTKRKFPLWKTLIIFFVGLFFMTALYGLFILEPRPLGQMVDLQRRPGALVFVLIIMAWFGFIGAVFGGVLGGIVGLIGKLFKKNIFIPGLKYGAVLGFMGMLIVWFLGCWINGTVCLPQ